MLGAELANTVDLSQVVRSDLDDLLVAELIIVHVVVGFLVVLPANVVHVELFVYLSDDEIEDRDNVGWVVLDLPVEHLVEGEDMVTIDVEDVAVEFPHLLQLLDVVGSLLELLVVFVIIVVFDLFKVVDEVFEFHLDITGIDVCAPKYLGMRTHFISTLELALVHHAGGRWLIVGKLDLCSFRIKSWLVHQTIGIDHEASLLVEVGHHRWRMQNSKVKKGAKLVQFKVDAKVVQYFLTTYE